MYNDQYDQALNYAYTALDLVSTDSARARCFTHLGWIFYDTENAHFAQQYHQEAYDIYRRLGDPRRIALSLNALGLVYLQKDEFTTARKYFDSTLQLARDRGLEGMVATALSNRGICENEFGKYEAAITDFNAALETLRTTDGLSHAEVLNQMAYSRIMLKEYPRPVSSWRRHAP